MALICCNNNKMPTPLATSQTFHNPPQWVLNKYQRMLRLPNLSIKFSIIHLFLLLTLDELRWEKSGLWDSNTASGVPVCVCMCQWATKSPLSLSLSRQHWVYTWVPPCPTPLWVLESKLKSRHLYCKWTELSPPSEESLKCWFHSCSGQEEKLQPCR